MQKVLKRERGRKKDFFEIKGNGCWNFFYFIGDSEMADQILRDFQRRHPGYSSIELRRIAVERRRIQKSKSDKGDYTDVISKYEKLMQDIDCPKRLASFYALKLARLHLKVMFSFFILVLKSVVTYLVFVRLKFSWLFCLKKIAVIASARLL